jgi:carbamoyl-phosphate synthase large subunit
MRICHNKKELEVFVSDAAHISQEFPITISKFIEDAKEIELDAVAHKGIIKTMVVSEHVENAGVHSGDATIVLPPQKMYVETQRAIEEIGRSLARALHITGPFNIQFLAKDNQVSVIEINLRASRTFPFISKVTGIDLIKLAVDAFFDKKSEEKTLPALDFVAVKAPQFSFARLTGADPILRVEMASTGEVACFGSDIADAFLKADIAVGGRVPRKGVFISLGGDKNKVDFLDAAQRLATLGLTIYATEQTARFLARHGVAAKKLYKIHENKKPNVLQYFQKGNIDLAINTVDYNVIKTIDDDYAIRRSAVDHNIPLFTNLKKAELFIKAITEKNLDTIPIKSWGEYSSL